MLKKLAQERFMTGGRKLEWAMAIIDGAVPRPVLIVEESQFLIDLFEKVIRTKEEAIIKYADFKERNKTFSLILKESFEHYEKGVVFNYKYDELLHIYKNDNIFARELLEDMAR